jgi:hypothetical protein
LLGDIYFEKIVISVFAWQSILPPVAKGSPFTNSVHPFNRIFFITTVAGQFDLSIGPCKQLKLGCCRNVFPLIAFANVNPSIPRLTLNYGGAAPPSGIYNALIRKSCYLQSIQVEVAEETKVELMQLASFSWI